MLALTFKKYWLIYFSPLFLFSFLATGKLNNIKKKHIKFYKKEVIENFFKLIYSNFNYTSDYIKQLYLTELYRDANFDNKDFQVLTIDDYIECWSDNNIYVQLFDTTVKQKFYALFQQQIILFHGIVAHVNCNKDIQAYLKISKNKVELSCNPDRIELDSQEFEKYFDVYSDNKILAVRLLTSDVMQTLVDFYNNLNLEFEIVIKNNNIYLRFFSGPLFEPKILGGLTDKDLLYAHFYILQFILDLAQKINLVLDNNEF